MKFVLWVQSTLIDAEDEGFPAALFRTVETSTVPNMDDQVDVAVREENSLFGDVEEIERCIRDDSVKVKVLVDHEDYVRLCNSSEISDWEKYRS